MRMQAKFCAGNDCRRFPQVTGANLLVPASKLREASNVLAKVDLFNTRDVSIYQIANKTT